MLMHAHIIEPMQTQKGIIDARCSLAETFEARRTGEKTGRYSSGQRKARVGQERDQHAGAPAKFTEPGKSCTQSCNNYRTGPPGLRSPLPWLARHLQPAHLDRG